MVVKENLDRKKSYRPEGHRCFPVNIEKFLRTPVYVDLRTAAFNQGQIQAQKPAQSTSTIYFHKLEKPDLI